MGLFVVFRDGQQEGSSWPGQQNNWLRVPRIRVETVLDVDSRSWVCKNAEGRVCLFFAACCPDCWVERERVCFAQETNWICRLSWFSSLSRPALVYLERDGLSGKDTGERKERQRVFRMESRQSSWVMLQEAQEHCVIITGQKCKTMQLYN